MLVKVGTVTKLSALFSTLFLDDLVEKNQKEVTIHDLDPLALTLLVDFSYTGEIIISEDNVQVSTAKVDVAFKDVLDEDTLYSSVPYNSVLTLCCSMVRNSLYSEVTIYLVNKSFKGSGSHTNTK